MYVGKQRNTDDLQQKLGLTVFINTCINETNKNNSIEDGRRQKEQSCCTSYIVIWDVIQY